MSARTAFGIVLAVTLITTLIATPILRRVAIRTNAIVAPSERRVHTRPTPLLGGIAMLIGFLAGMLVASRLEALQPIFHDTYEPIGVVVAAVLMLAVGTLDDVREVSPPAKIAGIVLCASILVFAGVNMLVFRIPFEGRIVLSTDWSYLISVLWVLGMTNAVNFIDGLDGLAAGIMAIAAGTFFLYTMQLRAEEQILLGNIAPLLAIIVFGMCVGFLPFNFHPARIFMGDGGALLLGLLMAASTMTVGGRIDQQCIDTPAVQCSGQTYFFFAPLFIPLFILGVPILDTAFAILRRAKNRSGVTGADKEHIHHRLMRLGHGQVRSVLILWAWTALLSLLVIVPVLAPSYTERANGLVPLGIAALGLALYTVLHPGVRSTRAERRGSDGNGGSGGTGDTGSSGAGGPEGTTGPGTTGGSGGAGGRGGAGGGPIAGSDQPDDQAPSAEPKRGADVGKTVVTAGSPEDQ